MIDPDDLALPSWEDDVVPLLTVGVPSLTPALRERIIQGLIDTPFRGSGALDSFPAELPAGMVADGWFMTNPVEEVTATIPTIEAVYMRHHFARIYEAESVEDAQAFLVSGEDDGELSSVGIVVDGQVTSVGGYFPRPPTAPEAERALAIWHEANGNPRTFRA